MSFAPPVLIDAEFHLESFDCGKDPLNQYLKKFALTNSAAGIARTYVTTRPGEKDVLAYYSLAAGSVERAVAPERVSKGAPNYPIPVVLIARLAVDRHVQGQGLGRVSCVMPCREFWRRPM